MLAFRAFGYTGGASALDGSCPVCVARTCFRAAASFSSSASLYGPSSRPYRCCIARRPAKEYFATSRSFLLIPAPGTGWTAGVFPFLFSLNSWTPSRFATARRFFRRRWRSWSTSAPDAPSCVGGSSAGGGSASSGVLYCCPTGTSAMLYPEEV